MKIAIVENETIHVTHLQKLLTQWTNDNNSILDLSIFNSGENLLSYQFHEIDLVFIDILLNGLTGVDLSHSLRSQKYEGEIVFLTSYSEYVFEGYDVHALNFIVKPAEYEKIAKCLNYVNDKLSEGYHIFSNQTTVVQIQYSKILYLTSSNHYTNIITAYEVFRQLEPMKNVFATLPNRFLYCHRTTIVNIEYILTMKGKDIVLSNGETIPVSNTYIQTIRSAIFKFAENTL